MICSTYPLDRSTLLLRDLDNLRARWDTALLIVSEVTTQDMCERLRVLREQLCELGV